MFKARLFSPLLASICLAALTSAGAQTSPVESKATPTAAVATAPAERQTDRKIERIHIEDAGSRIDELRVGGETQSITVAPKGGMPAYEVIPATGNRGLATGERGGAGASGGTRVWKVLGF